MLSIKKTIIKYFPIHHFLSHKSYSQEGEDMVLRSFYETAKNYKGFYIDIGAHHPFRFSNTLYFYKKGWKGMNIEPSPKAIKLFNIFRKRDINLNIGISENKQTLTYYQFNEPALNGFSKEISEQRNLSSNYKIIGEIPVQTFPLSEVLETYLPKNQHIDFMSLDAEGYDFLILQSNNWEKFSPKFILVEDYVDLININNSEIVHYLMGKNYLLIAKTKRTLFFQLKS